MTLDSHYFIEPLKGHDMNPSKPHPHLIYKANPMASKPGDKANGHDEAFCSASNAGKNERHFFMYSEDEL